MEEKKQEKKQENKEVPTTTLDRYIIKNNSTSK
jgi:hypothetical protein